MIRNYRDLTRLEMEQVNREETIVLIPLGALEQHGNQAPLGTDDIIAEAMTRYLKKELEAQDPDFPMLIFPVIPVGLSTEHKNFCGSITFKPATYYHMLYDICASLAHHGFRKIALLVCHGGNAPVAQILSRELRSELGISPFILSSGAFSHPDVTATISPGNVWDFHGGEMETSMVMAVDPSLVKLETSRGRHPRRLQGQQGLESPTEACPSAGCPRTGKQPTERPSASAETPPAHPPRRAGLSWRPAPRFLYPALWRYGTGRPS